MSLCAECDFDDPRPFTVCPGCGSMRVGPLPSIPPTREAPSLFVKATEVTSTPFYEIATGTPLDQIGLHGQGVPLGRLFMLSGPPGCGKSWLARLTAAKWVDATSAMRVPGMAAYFSYEEPIADVRAKLDEMKLPISDRLLFSRQPFAPEALLQEIGGPLLIVIDSVQTAVLGQLVEDLLGSRVVERDDLGSTGSARHAIEIVHEARQLTIAYPRASVLIICHETKDAQAAGPKAIEHLVDVVMTIDIKGFIDSGIRTLRIGKNRIGKSGVEVAL